MTDVEALFERYVEDHLTHGLPPDPADYCRAHPHLLEPLRLLVRRYHELDSSFGVATKDMTGRSVGRFRLLQCIGRGARSEVYASLDSETGGRVAAKVLPRYLTDDPKRLAEWRHEAEVIARVDCPDLVPLLGFHQAEGLALCAMELCSAPGAGASATLDDALARGDLAGSVVSTVGSIGRALLALHGAGVVHGDLKPASVLLTREGPKLVPMGCRAVEHLAGPPGADLVQTLGFGMERTSLLAPELRGGTAPPKTPGEDAYALTQIALQLLATAPDSRPLLQLRAGLEGRDRLPVEDVVELTRSP